MVKPKFNLIFFHINNFTNSYAYFKKPHLDNNIAPNAREYKLFLIHYLSSNLLLNI